MSYINNLEMDMNDQIINPTEESDIILPFHEGDILLLPAPSIHMNIKYDKLVYKVHFEKKRKIILNNVSGVLYPGELTAILGPSGAGKSTLLNILAGYKSNISSGYIEVNGQKRNESHFKKYCAYVMQDDVLLPNLTVMEYMMVSAKLRLQAISEKTVNRKNRVMEILKTLGLDSVANTNVSSVSGGQRKRVSIALELVSNPPVIFLDEPTSGLDSHSAYQCISLMNSLVKQGRTICCTIHQPSAKIFELFHKVVVLANGSAIYSGMTKNMIEYFGGLGMKCPNYHNPADFIIELASGDHGVGVEYLCEAWRNKEDNIINDSNSVNLLNGMDVTKDIEFEESKKISTTNNDASIYCDSVEIEKKTKLYHEVIQFSVLIKRSIRATLRDKMFTYLRLIATVLMSLLLGSLFYDIGNDGANVINNLGCIFFTLIYLIFICLMPTVLTFPLEKNVFIREYLNNWYTLRAYYLAKTFSDLPFQIILPILYCIVMYYMSGQPFSMDRFSRFLLVVVLSVMVSQSIGLLIGALAPNPSIAIFVAPVSGIPVLLFCGFFVKFSVIPVYLRWLTYVSYARYCWEGAIIAIYGSNRSSFECKKVPCMFENGVEVLRFLDMTEDALGYKNFRLWFCVIILSLFFVILRLITYIVLRFSVRCKSM